MINPISVILSISSLFIFLRILQKKIEPEELMLPQNPYKNFRDNYEDKDLIRDYYECLVECNDKQSECKRICKQVLL